VAVAISDGFHDDAAIDVGKRHLRAHDGGTGRVSDETAEGAALGELSGERGDRTDEKEDREIAGKSRESVHETLPEGKTFNF
jgi:hypothetical protein